MLEKLAGIAGGSCRAPVLPTLREKDVQDSCVCSTSVERLVGGRLDTCAPLGQILAGTASSDLGGTCQITWELKASLLRLQVFVVGPFMGLFFSTAIHCPPEAALA